MHCPAGIPEEPHQISELTGFANHHCLFSRVLQRNRFHIAILNEESTLIMTEPLNEPTKDYDYYSTYLEWGLFQFLCTKLIRPFTHS